MRKGLYALGIAVTALLQAPIAGAAANASAHIVTCTTNGFGCFSPNPIQVTVGSSVTWTNNTGLTHTSTSTTGAWDTGNISPGQTSQAITFNAAGTFTYHCSIHPSMTGTVMVSAAATATPAPTAAPTASPRVRTLAQGGGGVPRLPIGAGLALVGLALLAVGSLRRKPPLP